MISDIQDTEFPTEKIAQDILDELLKHNYLNVRTVRALPKIILDKLRGKSEQYATPTTATFLAAIQYVLNQNLNLAYKKRLITSERKVVWRDDGVSAEFFYKKDFAETIAKQPQVYVSHPYSDELEYPDNGSYKSLDEVSNSVYVAIMSELLDEFNPFWRDPSICDEGQRKLEETLRKGIFFGGYDFRKQVKSKIQYIDE